MAEVRVGDLRLRRSDLMYIAGPMTGIKDRNVRAFNRAEVRIYKRTNVMNPVENDILGIKPEDWILYMHAGILQLIQCSGIYMLKDWERSKGASMEFNLACDLKMNIEFEVNDPFYEHYEVEWL